LNGMLARVRAAVPDDDRLVAAPQPEAVARDGTFLDSWREELLARTWEELQRLQGESGAPHHSLLTLKTQFPEFRSSELAERAAPILGKTLSSAGIRQAVHRAREAFARLLVEEVARSLGEASLDLLHEELVELRLLAYCKPALERWGEAL